MATNPYPNLNRVTNAMIPMFQMSVLHVEQTLLSF